jgi:putative transposase
MQLVERHIFINRPDLQSLCMKCKSLYNQVIYYLRQQYFGKIQKFSEFELSGVMAEFDDPSFRLLPSNVSQQTIKFAFKAFKSFFRSNSEWKKNPSKILGKPKLPKYKETVAPAYFTYVCFRVVNGYIHFVKDIIQPIKTQIVNAKNIKQVRIIPQATCFVMEVVYDQDEVDLGIPNDQFISIDLGIDNLATCVSNVGKPFIANGKTVKSFNQWYNKTRAVLQSYVGDKGMSKRIKNLLHYRNCWMEDKMHKISRFIVDYCIENNIGTIVIGKNDGWKQEINMGNSGNQKFLNIPHARLIDKISHKAKLVGIEVKTTEESYTSKIDHLAGEEMRKQEVYLGKRVKRGLFQSSTNMILNADVNGCLGIARKVFGDSTIQLITNSGVGLTPYRMQIL